MRAVRLVCRPITAMLETDLPEPDSPTMPRVRPRSTANDSPSTDLTRPSSVGKCTRRSVTSRYGARPRAGGRPGRLGQWRFIVARTLGSTTA